MPYVNLMQSQRNEVLAAIQHAGMSKNEFEWALIVSPNSRFDRVSKLQHAESGFFFRFDDYEGDYMSSIPAGRVARYAPGRENPSEYHTCSNWSEMMRTFNEWLINLQREIDAEDLWSLPDFDTAASSALTNSSFNQSELILVLKGLDQVQALLLEHSAQSTEILTDIKRSIEYLKKSAAHAGRRDWLMMFVGVIVTHWYDWALTNIHLSIIFNTLVKAAKIGLKS